MHLKIKKGKRSAGKIKLTEVNSRGEVGWCVSVPPRSKFKELQDKPETAAIKWLVDNGYSYTKVYR